ncbi:hypothetical protein SKAU_G00235170 [Synaphobranchus kaupii]|uniref:Uncharacterized protein n=1 Tax=Synaphobranchus kaupii TaxID=118154 RepID=A0A9Q1F6V1_SYNKA|nr:hypothetical protein SKAU_G00235170 [Synaphobranchus kaupii]
MKIHCVRGIRPYVVASRERSCFYGKSPAHGDVPAQALEIGPGNPVQKEPVLGKDDDESINVRVQVAGKKRGDQMFVAKVESVHDDNYILAYMEETSKALFTWPRRKLVTHSHRHCDIVIKLKSPVPVYKGTRMYSQFNLQKAEELFAVLS